MIVHSLDRIRKCASEKCALIGEDLNAVNWLVLLTIGVGRGAAGTAMAAPLFPQNFFD